MEGCGYHNSHGRSQEARVQVRTGSRGHQPDGAGTAAPLGEPAHRTGAGQQASAQGRRLLTGLVSNAPQGTGVRKRYPWDGGTVPRGDCPFPGVPRQSPLPQSGCEPLKQENAPRNLGRSREARSPGVAAKPQVCSLGKGWGEGEQVNIWESQHPSPVAGRRGSCRGSLGAACPPRLPPSHPYLLVSRIRLWEAPEEHGCIAAAAFRAGWDGRADGDGAWLDREHWQSGVIKEGSREVAAGEVSRITVGSVG